MALRGTGTLASKLTLFVAIVVACSEAEPLEDEGNAGGSGGSVRGGSGGSLRGGASGGTAKGGTASSGNAAGAAGDGGAPPAGSGGGPLLTREFCEQYDTTEQCEAAGCLAADGTLYRLTRSAGGAGGAAGGGGLAGAPLCELVESNAFVACLEGVGGQPIALFGCEEDCESCVWSGWFVNRSQRFTRDDCGTYCE